jgi:aspartate/tyrosine/aromatic aminotransferase
MYIDERLIKILETHKEEQIHVTYAIDLIKKIAKEYEQQSDTSVVSICYAVFDKEDSIVQLYQTEDKANKGLLEFKKDHSYMEFHVDTIDIN